MSSNPYSNQLDPYNQLGAAGLGQIISYQPYQPPRTKREQLEGKLKYNESEIARLTEQNKEIIEALDLLDKHPLIERLDNLVSKLLRR